MYRPGHKDVSSHSDPSIQARFEMWMARTKREVTLAAKHLSIIFETARMGNNSKLDVTLCRSIPKALKNSLSILVCTFLLICKTASVRRL